MAVQSTHPGVGLAAAAAHRARRRGLLARCREWLRRRDDAARLREMDPRLARDIGVAPGGDRRPEGFAVDPRPLWGVGLTPWPVDARPPWVERHRG